MAAAEGQLMAAAAAEPLIAEAYVTPQSPPHHAEGPFMDSHLRRMLATLAAVGDGSLRLADIEDFRRLRGFEGEIDELQETLRERQAFFEAFILCHDAAKFTSAACIAAPNTRGAELGFALALSTAWEDHGTADRALLRRRHAELYRQFAGEHRGLTPEENEALFFEEYGIGVHYPGHDRMIHAPVYQALLRRVSLARRLPEEDIALLEHVIAHHLQPLQDFNAVRPERIGRYVALAQSRGYDGDDFIDVLQACLFLDTVAGCCRREGGRAWQDASVLVHFFQSEHAYAPWKRQEKELARAAQDKKRRHAQFRSVGLDGVALLELLGMEPGPKFGNVLNALYAALDGMGPMPQLPAAAAKEIKRRVDAYQNKA